jgi:hypothetical protein
MIKYTLGLLLISTFGTMAQTIDYKPGVAKLTDPIEILLKQLMTASGVTRILISDGSRRETEQVNVMYQYISRNSVEAALNLYGPEGDAVVNAYAQALASQKLPNEIKAAMLAELRKQLPSALKNGRLMHVGRENEFTVFDISISNLRPSNRQGAFEQSAKEYEGQGKLHRFLGTGEAEKEALHFEIKK